MTRWLVTGAAGMLGREVVSQLAAHPAGHRVTAAGRRELDIRDPVAVHAAVAGQDIVVNCAAWTAVDDAEAHEAQAFAANATGPALLARACRRSGAALVHVSTDYVFDGTATSPYPEDAPQRPQSAYGRTKAAGEWAVRSELPDAHWVVRTAWLYGDGNCFVRTIARLERDRDVVDVVDDQVGQPTWTRDVAAQILALVGAAAPPGTYHATSAGQTTWFGLASEVFTLLGAEPGRVHPTTSQAFPRPAPRPRYSVLGHQGWTRADIPPLRAWEVALREAVAEGATIGLAPRAPHP